MNPRQLSSAALTAAAFALLLAGCTSLPMADTAVTKPSAAPTTASAAPTSASTETPRQEQELRFPESCDDLITPEGIATSDPRLESLSSSNVSATDMLESLAGPMTWTTLQGAEPQLFCNWGMPQSDAIAVVGLGLIADDAKTDLISALQDSAYEETQLVKADLAFLRSQSDDHRYVAEVAFHKNYLVVTAHTISGDFTELALKGLQ